MTQAEKILKHLQERGGITSMDAFQLYGITRLSARICDLRRQGVQISNQRQKARNRDGETVYFDRYVLTEMEAKNGT
jgi:hypothetical protein